MVASVVCWATISLPRSELRSWRMRWAMRLYSAASSPTSSCERIVTFASRSPPARRVVEAVSWRNGSMMRLDKTNARITPAVTSVQRRRYRKRAQRRRHDLFAREVARDREHRNDHEEAADEHRDADRRVVPPGVRRNTRERG